MQKRNVGRWICMLGIAWATGLAVASCGNGTDNSVFGRSLGEAGASDVTIPRETGSIIRDGGSADGCVPATCASLGVDCAMNADGCGGMISCGTCLPPATCGGAGFNKCGVSDSGTGACVRATCTSLGYDCGYAGDGCGGELNCGGSAACTSPQFCGGGGFSKCGGDNGLTDGGVPPCTPATHCTGGQNCGYEGDGCGGVIQCGTGCTAPEYCGGGGFNVCGGNSGSGGNTCTPLTCATHSPPIVPPNGCGPVGDGCGGLIAGGCGSCTAPNTCGGGGVPSQCGFQCVGLCQKQVVCDSGAVTTITGTVVAGTIPTYGSPDPVPGVVVYVPNTPIQKFVDGVNGGQCTQCNAEVSGSPLVLTMTGFDGKFTLANVPVGAGIPIVIQLGKWRRQITMDIPGCVTTPVLVNGGTDTPGTIHMPRTSLEGDIPLTAISTGDVDAIECVLLKMGVDSSEFTQPAITGGTGRLQVFKGNGSQISGGTAVEADLMGGAGGTPSGVYANYDQILLPCWGGEYQKDVFPLGNLVSYANEGGHFFASHFSYTWLFENSPFNTTANFHVNHSQGNSGTAQVQLPPVNPKGQVFTDWLHLVGALPSPPNINISVWRHDVDSVNAPADDWISGPDPNDGTPMAFHYTFDTPFTQGGDAGAASECGHAIYSDFHVANYAATGSSTMLAVCQNNEQTHQPCTSAAPCPLTPQEKILEYMLWDLGQCVGAPPTMCQPQKCGGPGINCGPAGDGCGGQLSCGNCSTPQTCGGGGTPGQCGYPDAAACVPQTCADQGIACGPAGDGCGNLIVSCGTCTAPQTCGGGGTPGQCGAQDAGSCTPTTCAAAGFNCGSIPDGCGNFINCGICTGGQSCGIKQGQTGGICAGGSQ